MRSSSGLKGQGTLRFAAPFFNEFVLTIPGARRRWQHALADWRDGGAAARRLVSGARGRIAVVRDRAARPGRHGALGDGLAIERRGGGMSEAPTHVLRAGLLPEPLIFERGAPGRTGIGVRPERGRRPDFRRGHSRRAPPRRRPGWLAGGERARRRAALHAPLAVEPERGHHALPARLLHHEVQPDRQRGGRAARRASPACTRSRPTPGPRARSS